MIPDYKTEIEPLPGWCSEAKFRDIYESVIAERPKLCVEIGVFGGRSFIAFAEALKSNDGGIIQGVDPYSKEKVQEGGDGAENHDWWSQEELERIYNSIPELILARNLSLFARICRMPSMYACHALKDSSVDILHIDGNHSELGSTRDVELYLPKVKPGGIIYFDDINWPTTLKAQGMLAEKCDLLRTVDFCNVYRKR